MVENRFDVYLVNLDPTIGSEIQKTRPRLIISPDEMNRNIHTVIVAPMTTAGKDYPTRVMCQLKKKKAMVPKFSWIFASPRNHGHFWLLNVQYFIKVERQLTIIMPEMTS